MSRAWRATTKTPIHAADLGWETVSVALPPAPHLDEARLLATLEDKTAKVVARAKAEVMVREASASLRSWRASST